jgi:3-phenylpropionate/trans-cinnamate dioxygenase ferredoxin reductase component
MADEQIVIVGGGLAAARFVKGYREAGGDAPLVLLSADSARPYHRPPLSKGFLRRELEEEKVYVEPADFYVDHGVDVRLETRVTALDTAARLVTLDGGESVEYGRLVLASGSIPRTLGVPGEDFDGVHLYRTLDDARAVREQAGSVRRAVVVGGSFIGMETTASLTRLGVQVTQLDRGRMLFPAFQAPQLSASLLRLYRDHGVDVMLEEAVTEFRGTGGRLAAAITTGGSELEADLAIVGIGVTPSLSYLDGTGITVETGVLVNDRFETSVAGVYAIGDIARFDDPVFGHVRRIEHWSNANHQGAQLGRLLAGEDAPYDQVAYFFTEVFGVRFGLLGDLDGGHDELVMRGSIEEGMLLGLYLRGGRLVAALLHNQDDETQRRLNELLYAQPAVRNRSALSDTAVSPLDAFTG